MVIRRHRRYYIYNPKYYTSQRIDYLQVITIKLKAQPFFFTILNKSSF
ncbi:MAG: Hypothetical protein AJITA_01388 [Acetilactobacillus jinshanensis]